MSAGNGYPSKTVIEQSSMREALVQMVRGMTTNEAFREDLLQEASVHLWRTEMRRPGQTRSWYLQSCKFHLQHYLNGGRSIDSAKRWRDQLPLIEPGEEENDSVHHAVDSGNSVLTAVSAREIMELLSAHLTRQERAVLDCLADGLGAREIGRKLNLSHTMVIRHRRKIASLFTKLDVPNSKQHHLNNGNGSRHSNGNGNGKHGEIEESL